MAGYKSLQIGLLIVSLCLTYTARCGIPKKYKSDDDKSLYCNVCENIMIDVEEKVMEIANELSGSVSAYKLPHSGKRETKTFSGDLDEDDIMSAIDGVCAAWGQNLGTSKQNDGNVVMLKSTSLSGSFSGSLNFGGDASAKVTDMCKLCVKKQKQNMVPVVAENNVDAIRSFCTNFLSKKCKKIKLKKELKDKITALGENLMASSSDEESSDEEEEVELVEDKAEL
eukprot:CAMPEP_0202711556 /NCGR_PEP_ID=MMETSP1385-20130828/23332_1 /ASSEMBLY_ACC=CAM_ASM_000861 /TAXON_ID=933848 /ORGANISM="Elphidium margaritaceum" /LENGTH=225 /DNA_ID=CAMNT_0049371309 /DNA_START=24 /DNA_END=701 /DNA_ORIENTATION=-